MASLLVSQDLKVSDHIRQQLDVGEVLPANKIHWLSGTCVHESMQHKQSTKRQLIRLSMPSDAPWFDGYTVSPFGIKPTGPILPQRPQMTKQRT